MDKLRRAAEQMLEELEIYFDAYPHMQKGYVIDAITALRAALAEQPAEQEPVAWSVLDKRTGKHWYTHESRFTSQHYANEYSHREPDGSQSMCVTPLYTAPQPRREVELTDEEIDLLTTGDGWSHLDTPALALFARAVINLYQSKQRATHE